jgi:hypothetical protein
LKPKTIWNQLPPAKPQGDHHYKFFNTLSRLPKMHNNNINEMSWENSGEGLYLKRVSQFLSSAVTKIVSLDGLSMPINQMALYLKLIKLLKINRTFGFCERIARLALVLHCK